MKLKRKYKFPCGLEYEIELSSLFASGFVNDEGSSCPIHKDKCKK